MSRIIRLSLLAAATTALVACGGDGAKLGGGKEGAARALFEASQPAGQGGRTTSQSLLQALASGADTTVNLERTQECTQGGSVKLKMDVTGGAQAGSFKFELDYDNCNEDGVNEFNGKMTMEMTFTGLDSSLEMAMHMKGKIEISGDIDDFIDADVTETVSITVLGNASGSVSVKLDGTIKTSEGTYVYDHESVTITVDGKLPEVDGNS